MPLIENPSTHPQPPRLKLQKHADNGTALKEFSYSQSDIFKSGHYNNRIECLSFPPHAVRVINGCHDNPMAKGKFRGGSAGGDGCCPCALESTCPGLRGPLEGSPELNTQERTLNGGHARFQECGLWAARARISP